MEHPLVNIKLITNDEARALLLLGVPVYNGWISGCEMFKNYGHKWIKASIIIENPTYVYGVEDDSTN
jgi:hypothetical protein